MSKKSQVLIDYFAPPYEVLERLRIYLSKRAGHRLKDMDLAIFLGLSTQMITSFKSRQSPLMILYIVKWCVNNHLDPTDFIKKSEQ